MKWEKTEIELDALEDSQVVGIFVFYPEEDEQISQISRSCSCTGYSIDGNKLIATMNSGRIGYGTEARKSSYLTVATTRGEAHSLKMVVNVCKNKISD